LGFLTLIQVKRVRAGLGFAVDSFQVLLAYDTCGIWADTVYKVIAAL
jgi:hypothetical protein